MHLGLLRLCWCVGLLVSAPALCRAAHESLCFELCQHLQ